MLDNSNVKFIGCALDNLRRVPNSRDILAAGFPQVHTVFSVLHNPYDTSLKTQAVAIRITPAKVGSKDSSSFKPVYWDDGSIMNLVTIYATDDANSITLGGSVHAKVIWSKICV